MIEFPPLNWGDNSGKIIHFTIYDCNITDSGKTGRGWQRVTEWHDCLTVEVSDRLSAMETQRELVEYFRSLELALNEHKEKGTPKGDPTCSRIYTQLARDLGQVGIGRDGIREAAKSCDHISTFERLEQLRKKPIVGRG